MKNISLIFAGAIIGYWIAKRRTPSVTDTCNCAKNVPLPLTQSCTLKAEIAATSNPLSIGKIRTLTI